MGQAVSSFLVPGLPSCYGGSWPMLVATKAGDHKHLAAAAAKEPLLLLACSLRGYSLVHLAVEKGQLATLRLLVRLIANHAGELAARLGAVVKAKGGDAASVFGKSKHAPQLLQPALVLRTLLSWGDFRGITPLMLAARGGHADCLKLLLQHGADPLAVDGINRRTCLHYAACCGHQNSINVLLNAFHTVQQPRQGGGEAAEREQQPQVVLLQDAVIKDANGGNTSFVDLRTRSGLSALHYSAFWGCTGCVTALLAAGAAITSRVVIPARQQCELPIISGSTALHMAAENGHTAMVALLLHAHRDKMSHVVARPLPAEAVPERLPWEGSQHHDPRLMRNDSGDTALDLAMSRLGSRELLQLLLDPGVPLAWVLPTALERFFGGTPRIGVPHLATLAKAALDQHLSHTLDQLEKKQQQAQHHEAAGGADAAAGGAAAEACAAALPDHHHLGAGQAGGCSRTSSIVSSCCASIPDSSSSSSCGDSSCRLAGGAAGGCNSGADLASLARLPEAGEEEQQEEVQRQQDAEGGASQEDRGGALPEDRTCSICFDAAANVMVAGCRHALCGGCARSLVEVTTVSRPALCPFCRTGLGGFLAATHGDSSSNDRAAALVA